MDTLSVHVEATMSELFLSVREKSFLLEYLRCLKNFEHFIPDIFFWLKVCFLCSLSYNT